MCGGDRQLADGSDQGLAVPDGSSSIRAKKKAQPEMFEGMVDSVVKDDKDRKSVV
jgi:hypothetical protein